MKEEKFKVIDFIRELIVYMDANLQNFPRKELEIKTKLKMESFELLEIAYKANATNEEKRIELIDDIIAKIKVIDFLLNMCYDKQIINNKKYIKFGTKLDDIIKYASGWKKSITAKTNT